MQPMNNDTAAKHIADCNALAQSSPDGMARMLRFVLATIQQGLETVPSIVADFEEFGESSSFAFGSKRLGLRVIERDKQTIYHAAMLAQFDDVELLRVFASIPGIGVVKAGFCCQLFAGRVGCLDVHNIKLYGLTPNVLRYPKTLLPGTLAKKRAKYVELCAALGGPVELWARWCDYKASLSPNHFADGAAVSKLHVDVLDGVPF
jgi:hypothetical protein